MKKHEPGIYRGKEKIQADLEELQHCLEDFHQVHIHLTENVTPKAHFGHASFALLFFFGHIWHGARTLFRDVFAGIDPDLDAQVEFGTFQKLGDPTTRRQEDGEEVREGEKVKNEEQVGEGEKLRMENKLGKEKKKLRLEK
ncbi:unnamed protein product [Sphenostylis stenocarpa]|uniref:Uncharacterized protein n=1 Tax=Sphenostylis stenocarpa TaxID=92480 RepID=A0AA86VME2_9FABA|nr:unnamed protein product [Sphenostylis stenocarpa]